ncbi:unnamed protein product [Rhodiola kirilowii]
MAIADTGKELIT